MTKEGLKDCYGGDILVPTSYRGAKSIRAGANTSLDSYNNELDISNSSFIEHIDNSFTKNSKTR
jgi:hypothetical protein